MLCIGLHTSELPKSLEYRENKHLLAMSPELSINGTTGIEPDFESLFADIVTDF
jgi:hypothetical protein